MKWPCKVRNMPKKRLPAIVDRTVREKVTKRRPGIWWDSVVKKVWKDIRGNQEERMSSGKFGRYKTEVEERIERSERLRTVALRNKVKSEKHMENIRGVEPRDRNENVFAWPNGLHENA